MTTPRTPISDAWSSGAAYEPFMGRWSRVVAREVLAWLGAEPQRRWLDGGCGTGALTETILQAAFPRLVVGVDRSEAYVAYATERLASEQARFYVGDLQALPFDVSAFDVAISGLVLNFVPDQERAVREMARVARGGRICVYLWDYAGEMQFLRHFWDAAVALDPAASSLDEGPRFAICHPDALAATFERAGVSDIEVRAVDVPTVFRDFEDFWSPFLGGQGAAPSYVAALDDGARAALRERLRATLPTSPDGRIRLMARAWAARGTA